MEYKIGSHHIFKYDKPLILKQDWAKKGSFIKIQNNGVLVAQYKVIRSNQFKILGQITNTYGHKRRGK